MAELPLVGWQMERESEDHGNKNSKDRSRGAQALMAPLFGDCPPHQYSNSALSANDLQPNDQDDD
ncbi:MAG: hypothetical protein GY768_08020 [Planctomycetaceae bacterium]|nr:hypothetical protein [Planctomycetaceae bacterium]